MKGTTKKQNRVLTINACGQALRFHTYSRYSLCKRSKIPLIVDKYEIKVGGGTGQNGHCVIVDTSIVRIHSRGL